MRVPSQATQVFFHGGPRDGEEAELKLTPSLYLEGDAGKGSYYLWNMGSRQEERWVYRWSPPPPLPKVSPILAGYQPPSVPPEKPKSFWWKFLKYIIVVKLIGFTVFFVLPFLLHVPHDAVPTPAAPAPALTPTPSLNKGEQDFLEAIKNYMDHPVGPILLQVYDEAHRFLTEMIERKYPGAEQLLQRLEKVSIESPTPVPTPTPSEWSPAAQTRRVEALLHPTPTPVLAPSSDDQIRADNEKTLERLKSTSPVTIVEPALRAQLARSQAVVTMPYGEKVALRYHGTLSSQDALPRSGNTIGDAYMIGPYTFVWVRPDGIGRWIDP